MVEIREKVQVVGRFNLNDSEKNAMANVIDIMLAVKDLVEQADIVSPFTGEVFQQYEIDTVVDILQTIVYYHQTGKEFEIREE